MPRLTCTHKSAALGMETDVTIVAPNRVYMSAPGGHEPDWPDHPGWTFREEDEDAAPGVLYLLHGIGGNDSVWGAYSRLDDIADKHNVAIVCPSGYRSFWINQHRGLRVADWVTLELPRLVADLLRVDTSRQRTFLGGMSMGGYGAVYLAMRHPELYGHVIALSGVLDVIDTQGRRSLPGFYHTSLAGDDPQGTEYDLLDSLESYGARCAQAGVQAPDLWIGCGTEDGLLPHSKRFVQAGQAVGLDIRSEYAPGGHDYAYWGPALRRAMDALDPRP